MGFEVMGLVLMFDFDGVLFDSLERYGDAFVESLHTHGYTQIADRAAFVSLFDTNIYEGAGDLGIGFHEVQKVLRHMEQELDRRGHLDVLFFAGMPELVRHLAERFPLYVVTSNDTRTVEAFLEADGLTGVFREVLGADKGVSKVDKLRAVAARHPEARPVFIGDTRGDMAEGRAAEVVTIGVTWGYHPRERLERAQPHYVVDTVEALEALIAELSLA